MSAWVDLRRVDADVAQPERDDAGVDTGVQQPHRGGVSQDVGGDCLVAQRRATLGGDVGVEADPALDRIAAQRPPVAAGKQRG